MTAADGRMGVIFDLDGVLIDTGRFHKQAWDDLGRREGFVMSEGFFAGTFGMQNQEIIPQLFERELSRQQIDRMGQWKEERYRELVAGQLSLLPGARLLLERLREAGFGLAIGTSTPRVNLDFMLSNIEVGDCFDAYVTGEEVSRSKPAPDTFLLAAAKLKLNAADCVVVEDAVQGIQAGKAAKMAVVAVTTTRKREDLRQADLVVDSLKQLSVEDFADLVRGQAKRR